MEDFFVQYPSLKPANRADVVTLKRSFVKFMDDVNVEEAVSLYYNKYSINNLHKQLFYVYCAVAIHHSVSSSFLLWETSAEWERAPLRQTSIYICIITSFDSHCTLFQILGGYATPHIILARFVEGLRDFAEEEFYNELSDEEREYLGGVSYIALNFHS